MALKRAVKILRVALDMQDPFIMAAGDQATKEEYADAEMMQTKALEALALTHGMDE